MQAGGIVIAICLLVGAAIGIAVGQPSIGTLAGLGVGVAIAVVLALVSGAGDRPR